MTEYVTATQAARQRGLHRSTVWRLIDMGAIPGARQVGRVWLIPAESVPLIPKRGKGQRGKGRIPPGEILPGVPAHKPAKLPVYRKGGRT